MGLINKGKATHPEKDVSFTRNEKEFLLRHLSECEFQGKDVLVLASVVGKLQSS